MEPSPYAVKRGVLAEEMNLRYLPRWFYTSLRINGGSAYRGYRKLAVTVMNMKNTDELCPRSMLVRQRGLTGAGEERRSPTLSGPSQVDAAAGLRKTRGATAAAAEARAEERQCEEEGECEEESAGPAYL